MAKPKGTPNKPKIRKVLLSEILKSFQPGALIPVSIEWYEANFGENEDEEFDESANEIQVNEPKIQAKLVEF